MGRFRPRRRNVRAGGGINRVGLGSQLLAQYFEKKTGISGLVTPALKKTAFKACGLGLRENRPIKDMWTRSIDCYMGCSKKNRAATWGTSFLLFLF